MKYTLLNILRPIQSTEVLLYFKDCSTPSETGYDFTGTTVTTYLGTSNAACATGYDGTASPAQIQCEASGDWTIVTGCTIKGNYIILLPKYTRRL